MLSLIYIILIIGIVLGVIFWYINPSSPNSVSPGRQASYFSTVYPSGGKRRKNRKDLKRR